METAYKDVVVVKKIDETTGGSVEAVAIPLDDCAGRTRGWWSRVWVDGGAEEEDEDEETGERIRVEEEF